MILDLENLGCFMLLRPSLEDLQSWPDTDTPDFVQPYLGADGFTVSPFHHGMATVCFTVCFTIFTPSGEPKAHRSEGVRDESSGGRRKDNAAFQALSRKSPRNVNQHDVERTANSLEPGLVDHETVEVVGKVNVGSEVAVKVGQVGVHRVLLKET